MSDTILFEAEERERFFTFKIMISCLICSTSIVFFTSIKKKLLFTLLTRPPLPP